MKKLYFVNSALIGSPGPLLFYSQRDDVVEVTEGSQLRQHYKLEELNNMGQYLGRLLEWFLKCKEYKLVMPSCKNPSDYGFTRDYYLEAVDKFEEVFNVICGKKATTNWIKKQRQWSLKK